MGLPANTRWAPRILSSEYEGNPCLNRIILSHGIGADSSVTLGFVGQTDRFKDLWHGFRVRHEDCAETAAILLHLIRASRCNLLRLKTHVINGFLP